jgi:hypothetical protein
MAVPFFLVVSGELEAARSLGAIEPLITVFRAGQFSGEVNTLSGRRAMAAYARERTARASSFPASSSWLWFKPTAN